ncbi:MULTISPECIES: MBL fold metallo-hydrolase [unclassified Leifsonia]|uniref:MBL fold metallo-hydrolase n=1 Tax=unclassified Leifsonia TaxID=2663824 RepID=UPI0003617B9E|nr:MULTISPECIES: MBL fold metallo-hydrolase [unclassified Leifsonia]TDQ03831.1 glyoxylase-like metal-dependent hydrolase (beta-lactamase superfamily II) [Leifsonia sp. 115AMFTsu3.1]
MTTPLTFEVYTERREGLTRDLPPGNEEWRWVTNTATLIVGEHEAVLVDTFATIAQNERLIEWIRSRDIPLAAVYLTHGHGDHAYGVRQLRAAFPGVRALATAGTVAELEVQARPEWRDDFWGRLFPGQIPEVEFPEVVEGGFSLEGHDLIVVEAGHTDTEGTTSLWVPDAGLVVAGDVVYNATYPYLAETTAETRRTWVAALERLRALEPRWVVSGHKQPDRPDSPADIEATIQYFRDIEETETTPGDPLGFYERMLLKQPGRANVGSLWGAAKAITAERG